VISLIIKLTQIVGVVFWLAMIMTLASVIPAPYGAPIA